MTSETTTTISAQVVEVGCIDKRNVITSDGRFIGTLAGAYIDTGTWMVSGLLLEINKDVIDELKIKKPMLRAAKAMIMINLVRVTSDTVQLNVAMSELPGNLTVVE